MKTLNANDNTGAVLGGTDTQAETPVATTAKRGTKTPGTAARNRNGDAPKRDYTPRGTTYWARRVILLNGEPVGRGRPAKDGKGERKVVYVPVGMEYDVAVHGEGVKYNAHSHRFTHKRLAKDSVDYTFDNGVAPKGEKAKAGKPTKAKAKAKAKNGKSPKKGTKPAKKATKTKKSASVNVPVTEVPATAVETPAPVTVPVETEATPSEHSVASNA